MKPHRTIRLLLLTLALSLVSMARAGEGIPDAYFGMHIHNADAGTRWPNISFGAWRLWDANVTWRDLQPERERWNFTRLDLDVAMATLTHTELLLPLALTPQWASSRPTEQSAYGPGHAAEPLQIEDWQRYVDTVARRYAGRIAAFEIWNEPSDAGFFSGDIDTLIRLNCSAYEIIKSVSPTAIVVSPSASYQLKGIDWLSSYIARGGKGCFDVIGFHYYTLAHEAPEAIIPLVQATRSMLASHGLGSMPIWNTESGWYILNAQKPLTVPWHALDQRTASAYVARALILGWASGLRRFYWYAWDDGNLGLFDTQAKTSKPAAAAYTKAAAWMRGATDIRCGTLVPTGMLCEIRRDTGSHWALWSTAANFTVPVRATWLGGSLETLSGTRSDIKAGSRIELGPEPVLITPRGT
ncbi:hypothetical protein HCX48_05835 [Rhodocyclus tenuis]|nr:hypothetical protein [Rhodocyclus gracilis]NJA88744.1 hypothetical protein [Rhodocyclus gracilis]